jgi:hypothetical protein
MWLKNKEYKYISGVPCMTWKPSPREDFVFPPLQERTKWNSIYSYRLYWRFNGNTVAADVIGSYSVAIESPIQSEI